MIIGAHSIIYSRNPDADRAFLRDVLGLPNVDVGDGWLICGLPPGTTKRAQAQARDRCCHSTLAKNSARQDLN